MKQKAFFLAVLLMALAIPQSMKAYDFSAVAPSGQTLYYNINIVNGTAEVTSENGLSTNSYNTYPTGNLVIPSSVTNGGSTYNVTSIGSFAFYGCSGLTSIIIPNSVTHIGYSVFSACSSLTSVTIPSSVTSIRDNAFEGCIGLTSVNYTGTIAQWCSIDFSILNSNPTSFSHTLSINGSPLTNLVIPEGVAEIKKYAFYGCSVLTSVTIGNSVTSIGESAFAGCSGLTSVTIPSLVTSIGNKAFYGCSSLPSVTIPSSVTSIGTYAFYYVHHIEYYGSATGAPWGAFSMNGVTEGDFVYSDSTKHFLTAYIGFSSIVAIPSTVNIIGERAFYNCNSLTSVTIGNSVTSIDSNAFNNCSNLTAVAIGNSVTFIGHHAFTNCSGLTSVTIPNSVTSIGGYAFYGCSSLTSVTIPNSVTCFGSYAFSHCSSLTSVTIGNSVNSISRYAFYDCGGLTSVTLGNSVTSIGGYAFYGCSSLPSVTIPNLVTSIDSSAFSHCSGLTSVTIGNSVTSIGRYAFRNCSGLTSVYLYPSTPPVIQNNTFSDVPSNIVYYIPCGSTNTYQTSWGGHTYLESWTPFDVEVRVSDSLMGATTYSLCFPSALFTATANHGYHFTHWNDGNTQNPRTITLEQDTSLTAMFDRNNYTITAQSNNTARGSVSGGATVLYLDSVTISATANYGYHFDHWSDGSTDNPHTVVATQNMTLMAYFFPNQYILAAMSADETRGHVSGGGSYDYMSNRTIMATANYGYYFTQWNDGVAASTRTITLTQDTSFTASFAPNQYTLTVTAGEHGTASGGGTYAYGDIITIQAYPEAHYHFTRWNDGNTDNPRQYRVEGNRTLTAFFAIDTHTVSVVSNDIARGMVESSGTEFVYGTPCTVTATVYSGYFFAGWSNGANENPYTFAVLSDVELTAIFAAEGEAIYTVTVVSANPVMGSVSGGGRALRGGTLTIRAIPHEGFQFLAWNDGNTENPRVVTVTKNITYTARFIRATQSISTIDPNDIKIYSTDGRIVVRGAEGMEMRVFDVVGREVVRPTRSGETPILPRGVYLVKVGTLPARKVVVIR